MRHSILSTLVLGSILLIPVPASAMTLTGPIVSPINGHSYYLLETNTWTASQAIAVSMGGNLATVRSADENSFVYDTFATFSGIPRDLWIGLNDVAEEGTFVWVSGEPVTYIPPGSALSTDFGAEDYVHIIRPGFADSGAWNDFPDPAFPTRLVNGVVEVVPEPSTFALLAMSAAGTLWWARRRR